MISNDDELFIGKRDELIIGNPYGGMNESHQTKVICYCRHEDETFIKMIEIDLFTGETKMSIIKNDDSNNPSSRRQGVSILLEPEGKDQPFYLNIAQHKGHTYISTTQ